MSDIQATAAAIAEEIQKLCVLTERLAKDIARLTRRDWKPFNGLPFYCRNCGEEYDCGNGDCELESEEEAAERAFLNLPCTVDARRNGCTCRLAGVRATDIDPPEPIIDRCCPLHGSTDPDAAREQQRDDRNAHVAEPLRDVLNAFSRDIPQARPISTIVTLLSAPEFTKAKDD